ncbi:MAG: hypothetical protein H0V88_09425, partial [Pyrinomonadaceae bacterium]|nr:hypothetical protein [Pyrinomonadaceae bacterium]
MRVRSSKPRNRSNRLAKRRGRTPARGSLFVFAVIILTASGVELCGAAAIDKERASVRTEKFETHAPARYQVNLNLDFDGRTFTGTQNVRWINRSDRPTSTIYFHLYANLRAEGTEQQQQRGASLQTADAEEQMKSESEPRLEIASVSSSSSKPLVYSLDERETVLRVNLNEAVAPRERAEVTIKFRGRVPEIDADETGLFAHIVQGIDAALRDSREVRRARDVNFRSRGVMLLGAAYPVLAVRDSEGNWQRKVESSIGDMVAADVADYDISVEAPDNVRLFTSGEARDVENNVGGTVGQTNTVRRFTGENMRDFALIAGRDLQAAEQVVSNVTVRSVFRPEHERTGRRVLSQAAEAVRIYTARFGALPYKTVSVSETPFVAGIGYTDFAGLCLIASAFYVDFDAPATAALPQLVREQRASVEDSLEWTTAHVVAHQWWGAAVGNDREREPVLDEALAHWSALLYFRERHGAVRAAQALDDQLRGVYIVYRTFGGSDMTASHAAHDYRNSFQYAAIIAAKGALMFEALRKLLGDERYSAALRRYYEANRFESAELGDLRGALIAEAPLAQRRLVTRTFNRWLTEKRGDEDIAPPNQQLALALGITTTSTTTSDGTTNATERGNAGGKERPNPFSR